MIFIYLIGLVSSQQYKITWIDYDESDCTGNVIGQGWHCVDDCDGWDACTNDAEFSASRSQLCTVASLACCDPHFSHWGGNKFSYHGECDLVLTSSPSFADGAGLDIHIRTEIKNEYSFIKRMVVKVGRDFLEIGGRHEYYFNGVKYEQPLPNFAGFPIRKIVNATWCRDHCSKWAIYWIDFDTDGIIEVGAQGNGFLHVEIFGTGFKDSVGLLGKVGDLGLIGRDGTVIENFNLYGQEWQVSDSDPLLFLEQRNPKYPDSCILPKQTSRRLVDPVIERMAMDACSHLNGTLSKMCVFDVQATGDRMMAFSPMYV